MNSGRTVFAQLLGFVPFAHFEHLVDKYQANRWTRDFTAWSHFICMAYAQFTRREGLRDLIACLSSQSSKLYHVGLRNRVTRSTLADANERRNCELFESLGQRLIAMDSTTIDLCLKLFPWADFRSTKAAVKAHTVIDLRGAIPVMITITTGKIHDVKALDALQLPAGSIVVLDRGYVDFARLYALVQRQCSFVVRGKDNLSYKTIDSHVFDCSTGVRWQIELFFKWLKQNLTIKHFFGNSLNAVKSQIWIAVCVYLIALMAHFTRVESSPVRSFSLTYPTPIESAWMVSLKNKLAEFQSSRIAYKVTDIKMSRPMTGIAPSSTYSSSTYTSPNTCPLHLK